MWKLDYANEGTTGKMSSELMVMSFPFGAYAHKDLVAAGCIVVFFLLYILIALNHHHVYKHWTRASKSANFLYATFFKPYSGDGESRGQQAALESFYKAQVQPSRAKNR